MANAIAALKFVVFFTIALAVPLRAEQVSDAPPVQVPIQNTSTEAGEDHVWAGDSVSRTEHIYPSVWGQAGIFRVRSAYSLPEGAITFGIGGEFYTLGGAPDVTGSGFPTSASTIAESLFVGYAPTQSLSFSVMRRNSSTTYTPVGGTTQLVSSLGDFTFGGTYAFEITPSLTLSPILNLMIASNFNALAPAGSTFSGGIGALATYNFYSLTKLPIFAHANLIYQGTQIRGGGSAGIQPEIFYGFSRFDNIDVGLGGEIHLGDFIPFIEYFNRVQVNSGVSLFSSPSKISIGTRFMPLANKSLAVLAGVDLGTGQSVATGVPYTPPVQIIAQVSYTTGLTSSERKHYFTTGDVKVVNRKFIIKKNVNFKVGSAILEPSSTALLDQIADVIIKNNVHKLLIVGHTDSSHTDDYNLKLSVDRAHTVKNYLVTKGVAEEALMAQGYGKRKPRASNATEEGRAKNRRVEFFILE